MIHGRFSQFGQPLVSASLLIPRAARQPKVDFLIDTGADQTCLMPADAKAMQLNFDELGSETLTRGIGGRVKVHSQTGTATFLERGVGLVSYEVMMLIYPDRAPYRYYPSILGRDILNKWRIAYSQVENTLTAEALEHDLLIPLPISPDRPG